LPPPPSARAPAPRRANAPRLLAGPQLGHPAGMEGERRRERPPAQQQRAGCAPSRRARAPRPISPATRPRRQASARARACARWTPPTLARRRRFSPGLAVAAAAASRRSWDSAAAGGPVRCGARGRAVDPRDAHRSARVTSRRRSRRRQRSDQAGSARSARIHGPWRPSGGPAEGGGRGLVPGPRRPARPGSLEARGQCLVLLGRRGSLVCSSRALMTITPPGAFRSLRAS
jgi:hypothetical protein